MRVPDPHEFEVSNDDRDLRSLFAVTLNDGDPDYESLPVTRDEAKILFDNVSKTH